MKPQSIDRVNLYIDNKGRLCFYSERPFVIKDMTYNVKLITGMYHQQMPVQSIFDENTKQYYVQALSAGFNLLTPILYLCSNIAIKSYINADFETILLSNDLSMLELRLVNKKVSSPPS